MLHILQNWIIILLCVIGVVMLLMIYFKTLRLCHQLTEIRQDQAIFHQTAAQVLEGLKTLHHCMTGGADKLKEINDRQVMFHNTAQTIATNHEYFRVEIGNCYRVLLELQKGQQQRLYSYPANTPAHNHNQVNPGQQIYVNSPELAKTPEENQRIFLEYIRELRLKDAEAIRDLEHRFNKLYNEKKPAQNDNNGFRSSGAAN